MREIDDAIATYLASGSDDDLNNLRARPAALDRVVEMSRTTGWMSPLPPNLSGRDAVEAWGSLRTALAWAYPERFMDAIERGDLDGEGTGSEVNVVAGIRGARAVTYLSRFAASPDWLLRLSVARGLASREDEAAIQVIEGRVMDENPSVRLAAIQGVVWRDKARAAALLAGIADDASVSPMLQEEARRVLASLA